MVTAKQIIESMERWAPPHYAESWDNVGLMVGSKQREVSKIITSLDITPEVVDYAISEQAQMIISHHPFIFKGIKSLNLDSPQGHVIEKLIKNDIVVYSAHTNLDIAEGGLNDMLASRLGLVNVKGFVPTGADTLYKITTFVPVDAADAVRDAMAKAGAGRIGNYEACSFSFTGEGRFRGNDESHPVVGEAGSLTVLPEVAINVIVDSNHKQAVIEAMKAAHPYEEVAYEVFAMHEPNMGRTLGRVGELPESMDFESFREHIQESLPHANVRFGGIKKETVKIVALCSGGGAEFIKNAIKADAYVTGDLKYHDAQLAKELGVLVVDAGHFGTEEIVADGIRDYLMNQSAESNWGITIQSFENQCDFFFD